MRRLFWYGPYVLVISGLLIAHAPAQSHVEQAMKGQLGELLFTNTVLNAELKRVTEENTRLKTENEEMKNAKQNFKDGANNGGSGAQPSVRQEGGDTTKGGEGVQPR